MRHREARRRLASLLDGALDPAEDAAVRSHVEACPLCERNLLELELSECLLSRLPADLAPQRWDLAAEARLAAVGAPTRRLSATDGLALRTVAAALAVTLVLDATVVGPWRSLRTERLKLIHCETMSNEHVVLYDMLADPGEYDDLSEDDPHAREALLTELRAVWAGAEQQSGERQAVELDPETEETLRALGYID